MCRVEAGYKCGKDGRMMPFTSGSAPIMVMSGMNLIYSGPLCGEIDQENGAVTVVVNINRGDVKKCSVACSECGERPVSGTRLVRGA